jgi:hypothetical protein
MDDDDDDVRKDRKYVVLCGCAQYVNLWATLVGYTITASASMM